MENFEALLNESMDAVEMKPGELIMGDVMEANDDYVIISVGLKSDAEVPANEFKNAAGDLTVSIGDRVEVALEAVEDGSGSTRVSREKAMRFRAWAEVAEAYESDKVVNGMIAGKVKGGFTVDLYGLRAFLPGSLVDIRPIKDSAYIEGRDLEFKVIKLDQNKNNIVVSRRAIVENELVEEREKLLETLQEGQIVSGIVKNLTDYGAFVNLGGLDGLLHITDIAWKRIRHPSEVLTVGDEVEVRVLKFDRGEGRVSLGLKQLGQDPWLDLAECHPIGSKLFGRVTNLTDYGAFVELQEGVEGLVHLSEMDWTKKNIHPGRVCHIGDEVEVMVLDIDSERRRISLGMKQCIANPWEEFAAIYKKGDRITGQIRSITDFGVFVGVEGGIDGLVHLSDLSWDRPGDQVVTEFKKGDELTVVVLSIDPVRERIALGLKQATEDPFQIYTSAFPKGSVVTGVVTKIKDRSATIELAPNIEGQIRISELSKEHVDNINNVLKIGDEIEAKIMNADKKDRKISLSIKKLEADLEDAVKHEYSKDSKVATTLGDKLKAQLELQATDLDE
ncbi:MAG: 30S ribosomal protein S1 [Gammaproteobacteria bacterium]|nr:30S ribosomal protein S1 [Gammaproteobacteria bacterium]MCY4217817.1 30S ribosomal protein S1 [Gammaproteobacteria bacterium]MCY4274907.1 30S ribosomal protein S1 [Gammaproteobacteria bacterium]